MSTIYFADRCIPWQSVAELQALGEHNIQGRFWYLGGKGLPCRPASQSLFAQVASEWDWPVWSPAQDGTPNGVSEATAAASTARSYGVVTNILFVDIEARTIRQYPTWAAQFINDWCETLYNAGWVPGVYTSASTALTAVVAAPPEVIWVAAWGNSQPYPSSTLQIPGLPDGVWNGTPTQRIWQFANDVDLGLPGGVVDLSVVDSDIQNRLTQWAAPTPSPSPTPTPTPSPTPNPIYVQTYKTLGPTSMGYGWEIAPVTLDSGVDIAIPWNGSSKGVLTGLSLDIAGAMEQIPSVSGMIETLAQVFIGGSLSWSSSASDYYVAPRDENWGTPQSYMQTQNGLNIPSYVNARQLVSVILKFIAGPQAINSASRHVDIVFPEPIPIKSTDYLILHMDTDATSPIDTAYDVEMQLVIFYSS